MLSFCKNRVLFDTQHHGESCNLLQIQDEEDWQYSSSLSVFLEMLRSRQFQLCNILGFAIQQWMDYLFKVTIFMQMQDDAPSCVWNWMILQKKLMEYRNLFFLQFQVKRNWKNHNLLKELHKTWTLSFQKCEQQTKSCKNTFNKFLEPVMFILIHIVDLFPNHVFLRFPINKMKFHA